MTKGTNLGRATRRSKTRDQGWRVRSVGEVGRTQRTRGANAELIVLHLALREDHGVAQAVRESRPALRIVGTEGTAVDGPEFPPNEPVALGGAVAHHALIAVIAEDGIGV